MPEPAELTLRIDGAPQPTPRPRSRAVQLPDGTWTARSYMPRGKAYRAWIEAVEHASRGARDLAAGHVIASTRRPLQIDATVYLPRPKSRTRKAPQPAEPHDRRPDVDNIGKALLDGLLPLIGDDNRVWRLTLEKLTAGSSDSLGAVIHISTATDN